MRSSGIPMLKTYTCVNLSPVRAGRNIVRTKRIEHMEVSDIDIHEEGSGVSLSAVSDTTQGTKPTMKHGIWSHTSAKIRIDIL
jgi:hypothetical protein